MATQSKAAIAANYVKVLGMKLVPLPPKSKRPLTENWGNELLDTPELAADYFTRFPDANIGVALGQSRVCSLDVDDPAALRLIFEEFGWDLDELINTNASIEGTPGRARVMFKVPDGELLAYHSLTWPRRDDSKGRYTIFEIRAADTQQRQDVLPPSIHPDTNSPYRWITKPTKDGLKEPPEFLLQLWRNWEPLKKQMQALCPWQQEKEAKQQPRAEPKRHDGDQVSVIDAYNDANKITNCLAEYGYAKRGRRYLSPHSTTGLPGVHILDGNKCFIHHASDPLCGDESGQPVAPFDLFAYYRHDGDVKAAVKAAAAELGIKNQPKPAQASYKPATPSVPENVDYKTVEILDAPANDNGQEPYVHPASLENFFTILGYDREVVYIFQHEAKQLLKFDRKDMTMNTLLSLAPLQAWLIAQSKGEAITKINKDEAIDSLFREARRLPVFNPARIRGRGAWTDADRHVFHFGDSILCDGKEFRIGKLNSRFIYQAEVPFDVQHHVEALTDAEGDQLLGLASMFRWSMPASAALLAGWVALAPICGALRWRPHIWLTGGAGCGKSTILENYVNTLTRWCNVYAQGNSTEAGIRQTLGCDAVPVLFDESEQNNDREFSRVQNILALIRQASSESGAKTLKGTTTGAAMSFHVRSMFCLASIQVGIQQQADRERLTVLSLRSKAEKGSPDEKTSSKMWDEVKERLYLLGRDGTMPDRLFARMLNMLPMVLKAIDVFVMAAAKYFGNQRQGDQYGTLMAGAWCLISTDLPTVEDATSMIAGFDWTEHTESAGVDDASKAMTALMEARLKTTYNSEYSVFELIDGYAKHFDIARQNTEMPACELLHKDINATLQRYGMKVLKGHLMISNTSEALVKLMAGTPYQSDLRGMLSRVSGVRKWPDPVCINGATTRCLAIPIDMIV